jgi:hypothetical protein
MPMPNQIVGETGNVLYHNPVTTTLAETLADFKIHVEQVAGASTRVPVHRVIVKEIDAVLTDPRVVKSKQFTLLGQQADRLRDASNRAGRLAFLRSSQIERQHQINTRHNKQLTLLSEIGLAEDPVSIARHAVELAEVKARLVLRGMQLRSSQVLSEVDSQPPYLTTLLGPRPTSANLSVQNTWQLAAEKLVGRRIDLGITTQNEFGVSLETDHALTRTVSTARQMLGLGVPERGVHAGIGF